MYLKHTPDIIKPLAKDLTFEIPNDRNAIYLTFDDGPHPEITPWVLDQLAAREAKATFFLIGKHAEEFPELVQRIIEPGHTIGHHGYSHLSGWKTKEQAYLKDVHRGATWVDSALFRPPYGQITLSQAKALKKTYRIIMWSDLSADFDENFTPAQCLDFSTRKVQSGSIIVFHDSEKAWPRLQHFLPKALDFYLEKGFRLEAIPQAIAG